MLNSRTPFTAGRFLVRVLAHVLGTTMTLSSSTARLLIWKCEVHRSMGTGVTNVEQQRIMLSSAPSTERRPM